MVCLTLGPSDEIVGSQLAGSVCGERLVSLVVSLVSSWLGMINTIHSHHPPLLDSVINELG